MSFDLVSKSTDSLTVILRQSDKQTDTVLWLSGKQVQCQEPQAHLTPCQENISSNPFIRSCRWDRIEIGALGRQVLTGQTLTVG